MKPDRTVSEKTGPPVMTQASDVVQNERSFEAGDSSNGSQRLVGMFSFMTMLACIPKMLT
jgi:hypothetical protein